MAQTREQLGRSGAADGGDHQPPHRYAAALANEIEARWQQRWEERGAYHAPNPVGELAAGFELAVGRPKMYVLDMFPYPSGVGLHVGHPLGYIATDIYARYLRMAGFNVLHAMGYDAFGLPAEQYAVQTGQHPRVTTERNIATMRAQLKRLGLGHDERRSVATTDVDFYKWTQWIFLQIYNAWWDEAQQKARPIAELVEAFESGDRDAAHPEHNPQGEPWSALDRLTQRRIIDAHRLACISEQPVNWCPALGTVLANEEVTAEGRSERGDHPVYKRPLKQWMLRITVYAQRLLRDLDGLDWPEPIKLMQRNWIGKSEGANIRFPVEGASESIEVFTTRPDTVFGASFMVLAPEHPLVDAIAPDAWPEETPEHWKGDDGSAASPREAIDAYRARAAGLSDVQRQESAREKTGVFTGACATNPASGERVPIFIADYVLMGYGSGAIMAVPGHDQRDFEFAEAFDLPIFDVVYPRTVHAIRWFTERAGEPDSFPEGWKTALADFLGLVVRRNLDPDAYDEALGVVRSRRRVSEGEPPSGIERRGSVREVWIETLGGLAIRGVAGLREEFMAAAHWKNRGEAFLEPGVAVNSPPIEGLPTRDAKKAITRWLEEQGAGEAAVAYKLRDWLFSRQRYWGEPFPIVYDEHDMPVALPESLLPVELPEMDNFAPETRAGSDAHVPEPPLARAKEWATPTLDLGDGPKTYRRELNTMPQWAGSCWYYLRYIDPSNSKALCDPANERYWMAGEASGFDSSRPPSLSPGGAGISPAHGPTSPGGAGVSPAHGPTSPGGAGISPAHGPTSPGGAGVSPAQDSPKALSPLRTPRLRKRNLPHLEHPGGTYFITFRTRSHELSEEDRQLVLDACRHWHGQRMTVHIATVMPDHVHLLITPLDREEGGCWALDSLMHSVKSFSAHVINEQRGARGALWQGEYHDRLVRDEEEFLEKWRYVATNPVRVGLARSAEAYPFTWAPAAEEEVQRHGRDARATKGSEHGRDAHATKGSEHGRDARATEGGNKRLGGVDLYVGGAEHAVLHLLYARFWHKILYDLGHVSTPEPFQKLFNQGYIQAHAYRDARGVYVEAAEVVEDPTGSGRYFHEGKPVTREYGKMGKSLKNALTPDEICRDYGADTLRLYEMSMGPLEQSKPWNTRDIIGAHRFLQRVWRNVIDEGSGALRVSDEPMGDELERKLHATIAGVREDMDSLRFNTAIAKLIEFNNALTGLARCPRDAAAVLTLLLAPFAPHIAEELWSRLGCGGSVVDAPMPEADEAFLRASQIEVPVQVMGKVRARITAPADIDEEALKEAALSDERVQKRLAGKQVRKIIVAPGRKLVNIVVG